MSTETCHECNLCGKRGYSVMEIQHGSETKYLCSYQWNQWLNDLMIDGAEPHEVHPEGCESNFHNLNAHLNKAVSGVGVVSNVDNSSHS